MQTIDVTGGFPEYTWPTTITEATGKDISTSVVKVALVTSAQTPPAAGDAAWRTPEVDDPQDNTATRVVQLLVGPGGLTVAAGSYHLWVKIADSPEIAPRRGGPITIT